MNELSAKELDLLQRIDAKEDLRPLFFRKVKGLKWFDSLSDRGYFNPEANPKPVPAKEDGYVNIPAWLALDYLVNTALELNDKENKEYSEKFLQIIVNATTYAERNEISNYRTWWKFAEVISQIPYKSIPIEKIDIIDYWLDDKYERGLVAQVIGEKWLPRLLKTNEPHAKLLSMRIIELLYKVVFIEQKYGEKIEKKASFRFKSYYAKRINERTAKIAGEKLELKAVLIFAELLINILDQLKNDSWSSIWQPSIEDHEQNKHRDAAVNILIQAYRDSIDGCILVNPNDGSEYIKSLLVSDYQTIQRIAIYAIGKNYHLFSDVVDQLLSQDFLNSDYRHEMWHFLNKCYPSFSEPQKEKILELISGITRHDDNDKYHEGASEYAKAIWFSAIKVHGEMEAKLYAESTKIAKSEPDHPDFSSYMSVGWVGRKSPKTIEELQALSINKLVQELGSYIDSGRFDEPGLEGLVKVFKDLIKTEPLKFYLNLDKFLNLDLAYIYEILEAYRELWVEKSNFPWDEIWQKLLEFCSTIIAQNRFWNSENEKQRKPFVANRYWIVSSIGRLIEAGTKSDDHTFDEKYLPNAEAIIKSLLNREEGEEYNEDSDAVSISINSPRGHCIEALINLTLRSCRIADKNNNKDHSEVWSYFQHYYDTELDRSSLKKPEYEFATLVANYLPNFLYLSKQWVIVNLSKIFDQTNYLKWLCAMQGYSYVSTIYQEIYKHLKDHGDLLRVLDDKNIKDNVEERAIQNIAIAYINNYESFDEDNSLINTLISRNDYEELSHLVWFMWTLRKKGDDKLKNKIYKLWPKIIENIDFSTKEGRKMASQLCHWAVFVDQIDEERRRLLLSIAPYSEESYNSYVLLECISGISENQPYEAHEIWMKMLEGLTPDYPEESVKKIFKNLIKKGSDGLRKAREAESEYIKNGNDRPSLWLKEVKQEFCNSQPEK